MSSALSTVLSDRTKSPNTNNVPNPKDNSSSPACSRSTASVSSSSDNNIMSNGPVVDRPTNIARVDQDLPSKVPVLHSSVISPAVMREFQNSCLDYFDNKETVDDKQVRKILPGIKDPRIP
jgi:hypothetical protein